MEPLPEDETQDYAGDPSLHDPALLGVGCCMVVFWWRISLDSGLASKSALCMYARTFDSDVTQFGN